MVAPEQVLHSVLVLTWDADDMADTAAAAESTLGLGADDRMDAVAHINAHRGDDGEWGGRAAEIEKRARERVQFALEEGLLSSDFKSLLATPDEEGGEDDVFATLGVQSSAESVAAAGDALEAFMDDEEEEGELPIETVVESDEEDDDDDVFATLGVSGPSVALAELDPDDPLAALMDDNEEEDEDEDESEEEPEAEPESSSGMDELEAYRMVLETVWVDGVLDPGEVNLLARRRADLGLSFEDHLALVREILG